MRHFALPAVFIFLLAASNILAQKIEILLPPDSEIKEITLLYAAGSPSRIHSTRALVENSLDRTYLMHIPKGMESNPGELIQEVQMRFQQEKGRAKIIFTRTPALSPEEFLASLDGLEFQLSPSEWAIGKIWNGKTRSLILSRHYDYHSNIGGMTKLIKRGMRRKIRIFNALYQDAD